MNLASHIKEILDSGAVDSLKIEGRTKSPYYAAVTAKAIEKLLMIIMKENLSLKNIKESYILQKIEVSQMHI